MHISLASYVLHVLCNWENKVVLYNCIVGTDRQICYKGHCFGIKRLCRVMPNSDPRDIFIGPYLTLMIYLFTCTLFVPTLEFITILP